jgi:hypothetical protein
MKIKGTLKIHPFSCKVHFIVTDEVREEMNKLYKKYKGGEKFEADVEGCVFSPMLHDVYILIDTKYLTHNTIGHEIFHAVNTIQRDREIIVTPSWVSSKALLISINFAKEFRKNSNKYKSKSYEKFGSGVALEY